MPEGVARAVSFDFGQTLAELDTEMLSRRLLERGVRISGVALERHVPTAWAAYDRAVRQGQGGHPWKLLMCTLLSASGASESQVAPAVDWLWSEQPKHNLWRRPIPSMLALVQELALVGVPVAVLSNSEGKLDELVEEMGLSHLFVAIADSGRLGMEKPDRAIFEWTADQLGASLHEIVHIGDSRAADVDGALASGMRAIWYAPAGADVEEPPRMRRCRSADEVREVLQAWGALGLKPST